MGRHPRKPRASKGWEGKGETGRGKKGEGRGSPGKLLYTDHFSIEEQTPLARCETEAQQDMSTD